MDQVTAQSVNSVAGFTMSMKTRPLVIAKFEEFVRNKLITINSMRLVNEIKRVDQVKMVIADWFKLRSEMKTAKHSTLTWK